MMVRPKTEWPSHSIASESLTTHQSLSPPPYSFRPSHEAYSVERTTMTHETNSCTMKMHLASNLY